VINGNVGQQWRLAISGKTPLRAATIELIIDCSGGEQWSEHY
jgi:hypothetical protein